MGRGDLTGEQWARLEPLLPVGKKPGRPPVWSKRQLINGIRWRTRTGAPWRDVPARYGEWETVYGLFRRWQRDGTWSRILTQLQAEADAKGLIIWDVSVDSTVAQRISMLLVPAKGGSAAGQTRRSHRRHRRPRARTLTRWTDHEGAPRGRARTEAAVLPGHRRSAARQPPVPARPGAHPSAPHGRRQAALPTGPGAGRQSLRVPNQPRLPAQRGIRCTIPLAVRYEATVTIAVINEWL